MTHDHLMHGEDVAFLLLTACTVWENSGDGSSGTCGSRWGTDGQGQNLLCSLAEP